MMKRFERILILALVAVLLITGLAFRQRTDELQRRIAELEQRQAELENSLQEDKPTASADIFADVEQTMLHSENIASARRSGSSEEVSSAIRYILSDADRDLIERVVMAESGNQPFEGQVAVASCIYNTAVAKGTSPAAVVQAKGQYASPYGGEVMGSVKQAVSVVFDEDKPVEGIMYFYAPAYGYSRWHENSLRFLMEIKDHRFFGGRR